MVSIRANGYQLVLGANGGAMIRKFLEIFFDLHDEFEYPDLDFEEFTPEPKGDDQDQITLVE